MSGRSTAPSTHAAIVLAAGGSRRLGRPKQLLTREGETLVHRVARLAQETAPRRLIVVVGAQRDAVVAALDGLACEVLFNADWEDGLASSLRMAADALADHDGPVLVAGCDQPALARQHLQALLEGAATAPAQCAATRHGNAFGIPVAVSPALLAQARDARGDRGLAAQLRALPASAMFALDAPELGFDLDTEDDVGNAIARGWLDASPL